MGVLPAIMVGVGTAISAGATLMGGMATASQNREMARHASRVGAYNRSVAAQQAQLAREQAAQKATLLHEEANKLLGRQRALFASFGVTFEGSPLMVMADTAAKAERDIQWARYAGELDAWKYDTTGTMAGVQAGQEAALYDFKAGQSVTSGIIGAGTSLLTGAGKYLTEMQPVKWNWTRGDYLKILW